MGLNEQSNNDGRWTHPPKKKWIHCYMSVDDECKPPGAFKTNVDIHCSGTSRCAVSSSVNHVDTKAISLPSITHSSPGSKKRARDESHISSYNHLTLNCHSVSHNAPSYPIIPIKSTMGLVRTFNSDSELETTDSSLASLPVDISQSSQLSLFTNGCLRSNGVGKAHSPHSRDYDDHFISKEEAKKRSGSTPSREVHNKLEKNRRAHLKECFETLRRQLPSVEDKKISNQTILKAAHRYIQTLKRKEREYDHEMERLARQKIAHQQHLACLKKELQAKWDHIDFTAILPDMASLEQQKEKETKSTTTASEQPDFEDESHDSSAHSNSLTLTMSSPELKSPFVSPTHVMDLTHSATNLSSSYNLSRDIYIDPNQPLNLSTSSNIYEVTKSSLYESSQVRSSQDYSESDWSLRNDAQIKHHNNKQEGKNFVKPLLGSVYQSPTNPMPKISSETNINSSTNNTYMTPVAIKGHTAVTNFANVANATHLSHLIKSGTTVSGLPSVAKVVTTFPNVSLPSSGTSVINVSPTNIAVNSNVGQIHTFSTTSHPHSIIEDNGVQRVPSTTIDTQSNIPQLTTVTRVSTSASTTSGSESQQNRVPIMAGGNGISLPAQIVASGLQLSGNPATLLSQHAFQVITPEGYKLVPAEHGTNGAKPLSITLAHPEGIEHVLSEDGKGSQVMVAVNKNGLPALHLTVPTVARTANNSQGNSIPVTSVPLNLTGAGTTVKVTQTGTATSLLPPYLPLTHTNGITQLVQGMSLVGPIVVSQPQRGVVTSGTKPLKGQGGIATKGVPLVPTQFANSLASGMINSVVVVSQASSSMTIKQ